MTAYDPFADIEAVIYFRIMRTVLLLPIALLIGAGLLSSTPMRDSDFEQLMNAAAAASSGPSEIQLHTRIVCVQRNLRPPFESKKGWIKSFQNTDKGTLEPRTGDVGADKSIGAAMSSKATVASQTSIRGLPERFMLVDKALPPQCVIPHGAARGPNWERDESIVVVTFTRPALANGYAFIEEHEDCAGICGTTFLRVFQKRRGKWSQVGRTTLSQS